MDREKYWKLAERYLEEFIYPDQLIEEKFETYKEDMLKSFNEFFYAYDAFYIVADLMGWSQEESNDWFATNVERINELYKEVYGEDANYVA